MKIVEKGTRKVLYGGGEPVFRVTPEFWAALVAGNIFYRTGGDDGEVLYTLEVKLDTDDFRFEEKFMNYAVGVVAQEVMAGNLPVDTVI